MEWHRAGRAAEFVAQAMELTEPTRTYKAFIYYRLEHQCGLANTKPKTSDNIPGQLYYSKEPQDWGLRWKKGGYVYLQGVGDHQGEPVLVDDGDAVHEAAVPHWAGRGIPLHIPPPIAIDCLVNSAVFTLWAAVGYQCSQPVSAPCQCINTVTGVHYIALYSQVSMYTRAVMVVHVLLWKVKPSQC